MQIKKKLHPKNYFYLHSKFNLNIIKILPISVKYVLSFQLIRVMN